MISMMMIEDVLLEDSGLPELLLKILTGLKKLSETNPGEFDDFRFPLIDIRV
jgi:hypothetical protein